MVNIIIEDAELEKSVLCRESCLAVPVEIFVPVDGDAEITVYSSCMDAAKMLREKYSDCLTGPQAATAVTKALAQFAGSVGYAYYESENSVMLEFSADSDGMLNKSLITDNCILIDTNEELSRLCAETGCDIEICGGDDVIFAVVNGSVIEAYAGVNDIAYGGEALEISVETAENSKRQGFGSACVTALAGYLISRGYKVLYKCSASNTASAGLARKCGFRLEGTRRSFVYEKLPMAVK